MGELQRQLTGVPGLDDCLGGGLLPGTLTVIVGATGVGKTQLGLQFANAGASQEGNRGVVFDVCARGEGYALLDRRREACRIHRRNLGS